MRYAYCFSVWPEEQHPRWTPAVYALFRHLTGRVEMEFDERGFNDFREELCKCGLSLREIERRPWHEPEAVF